MKTRGKNKMLHGSGDRSIRIRVRARVPLLVVSVGWMYPRGYRPVVSRPGRFTSESKLKLKLNQPPSRVMCRAVCDATCPSCRRDFFFGCFAGDRGFFLCVWVYSTEVKACVCPAADFAGTPVPLNLARLPRPSQTVEVIYALNPTVQYVIHLFFSRNKKVFPRVF